MRRRFARSVWLSAALVFLPTAAFGQAFTWGGLATGNWSTAGNWMPAGGPPTAGDTATLGGAGSYFVNISSGGNAADALTVTGGTYTLGGLNLAAPSLLSLTTGAADLTVNGGGTLYLGGTRPVTVSVGDTVSITGVISSATVQAGSSLSANLFMIGTLSSTSTSYLSVNGGAAAATNVSVGLNSGAGLITLSNAGTLTVTGTTSLVASGFANTSGNLSVGSGSTATLGTLNVGTGAGASGQSTILSVFNTGSSLTMTGASPLTVGSTTTPITAGVNVDNNGLFNSGTGAILFRNTATLYVNTGGVFNANGNVTLDDGDAIVTSSGTFNLAAGKTVTMNNGATFGQFDGPTYSNGSNLTINSGSDYTAGGAGFQLGDAGAATTVSVNGLGSTFTSGVATTIGHASATANQSLLVNSSSNATITNTLNIVNRGVVTVGANSALFLSGSLNVTAGGTLTATSGLFAPNLNNANITVGAGGTASLRSQLLSGNQLWTVEGSMTITDTFRIGDEIFAGGTMRVLNAGSFGANGVQIEGGPSAGVFRVSAGGSAYSATSVTLRSYNSDALLSVQTGGTFEIIGPLSLSSTSSAAASRVDVAGANSSLIADSLSIGDLNAHAAFVNVTSGGGLKILNAVSINPGATLTVDGGALAFGTFTNDGGSFNFLSGSLNTNSPQNVGNGGAVFGKTLVLGVGKSVDLNNTLTLESTGTLHLDGGLLDVNAMTNNGGQLILDRGTLKVNASANVGAGAMLGNELTLKPGLTITATQLTNNGLVHGDGTVTARLLNDTLGELRVDLGHTARFVTTNPIGHTNLGQIVLNGGRLDLNAALNNGPQGDITGRGTLVSTLLDNAGDLALSSGISDIYGDVANNSGGRILISGNADVTFWDDVTNNAGATLRVSAGSSATFFGTYAGGSITGSGTVYFEADVTPGFSPAQIAIGGDVRFSEASNLVAEINGATRGSQYDAIDVAGAATLTGQLTYPIAPGYDPAYGVRHNILHATNLVGQFQPTPVLQLSATKWVVVLYDVNDVLIAAALPGDANVDGSVGFDDLLALAQHYNLSSGQIWQTGDFEGNGSVAFEDLLILAQHYGNHLLSADQVGQLPISFASDWAMAQSLVPEPATVLAMLGSAMLLRRRPR